MKHISIRLPWHDRGWDGCVCDNPKANSYCMGFHSVNAEKIRTEKENSLEDKIKGQVFDSLWEYKPPCTETINAFGSKTIQHINVPKSFIRNTSSKTVDIGPNTTGTWPFEDMWDELGERREANERKKYVDIFFEELKQAGKAGLIFYYCNYDNPVSGDDKKYLLVGIARIKNVFPFEIWDDIPQDQKELYGEYIWSRLIENDPVERIRLPYQEYLKMNKDVRSIAVFCEGDLSRSFKYVAHHVTDDNAISLIDKTIVAVKKILHQKFLPEEILLPYKQHLEWLKLIRKECWISRGLYPGLASVLNFLGMDKPEEFIRINLKDYPLDQIKSYFFDRFNGKVKIGEFELNRLSEPKNRFATMFNSGDENEKIKAKLCCDRLPFFDLTSDQVKNILGDKRGMYSIFSSLNSIYENPYIISEEYIGRDADDFINFEKIDHGMIPSDDLGDIERICMDNPIRLRALMHTILKDATNEGHTFIEWTPLVEKVNHWHELNDKAGLFNFDKTTWEQHKHIFSSKVVEDRAEGIQAVYLKKIHDAERKIRSEFLDLVNDSGIKSKNINWKEIIEKNGTEPNNEQVNALELLYTSRLGVLTGTAGTGKTTVIRSLIQGIKQKEPRHDFLILAPTGKASIILRDRIKDDSVEVQTIHSFLMRKNWINKSNFTLKVNNGDICQVSTVIIDECSMIEVLLFATILRALDMNNIERLVLVGDYNQLPPIGPGKIFFDLIQYLKKDESKSEKHLAELYYNWRQAQGSRTAVLASHYAKIPEIPDEDIFLEIKKGYYDLSNVSNKSDLKIETWKDEDDLLKKIPKILNHAINHLSGSKIENELGKRYDDVHGIPFSKDKYLEAINIISPYRHTPSGVDNINILIQRMLRGQEIICKFNQWGYVFNDKVIQIKNNTYKAYNHQSEEKKKIENYYVPNGTLGFVFPKKIKKLQVKFPSDFNKYSFYLTKSQVKEMLELGYATSVHKAQGSQFSVTIIIIPNEDIDFLNRELLYTALTRSTSVQYLLLQNNINILENRLWLGKSDIVKRNSSLFKTFKGIPSKDFEKYKPETLIHEVLPDIFVRSKAEKVISKALIGKGIYFYYEKPLIAQDNLSFKLPDFTFKYRRKEYYWEHNGMMADFDYERRTIKKKNWYIENGYQDNLIETPIEGMNLTESINYVFENILNMA